MGKVVQNLDFKDPKIGSKYALIINEGCTAALYGIPYANKYKGNESLAFEHGYRIGVGGLAMVGTG